MKRREKRHKLVKRRRLPAGEGGDSQASAAPTYRMPTALMDSDGMCTKRYVCVLCLCFVFVCLFVVVFM